MGKSCELQLAASIMKLQRQELLHSKLQPCDLKMIQEQSIPFLMFLFEKELLFQKPGLIKHYKWFLEIKQLNRRKMKEKINKLNSTQILYLPARAYFDVPLKETSKLFPRHSASSQSSGVFLDWLFCVNFYYHSKKDIIFWSVYVYIRPLPARNFGLQQS